MQPATRFFAAKQRITDGFLHGFPRRITHPARALFLAVAVAHNGF
jgi:hypothetical protein